MFLHLKWVRSIKVVFFVHTLGDEYVAATKMFLHLKW